MEGWTWAVLILVVIILVFLFAPAESFSVSQTAAQGLSKAKSVILSASNKVAQTRAAVFDKVGIKPKVVAAKESYSTDELSYTGWSAAPTFSNTLARRAGAGSAGEKFSPGAGTVWAGYM
jgi:hypothetical protein